MALYISTFGNLAFKLDGQDIDDQFRTDKERALILYLALNPEKAHQRDALGELLWPDRPPGAARTNLRQALYGVRRALQDRQADPVYVLTSGDTLQVNPKAGIELDTIQFSALVEQVRRHYHPDSPLCSQCRSSLERVQSLYQGEFLTDLVPGESLDFQEWLLLHRERYQREYLLVLEMLTRSAWQEQDHASAVELARRLVAANPLDESGHRLLMQSLADSGRRNLALEHYQSCRKIMLEELGVEPSQETRTVYETIRHGSQQPERKKTGPLRRRTNLPGQLTAFVGRSRELSWFESCLQRPECRLITIAGMSGIGKTRLALEVCRQHTGKFNDGVWYVPVESLQTSEQLVFSIGSTLGLHFNETNPQRVQLLNFLAQLNTLVLLDGFENLVPATDLLIEILQRAPEVKFMVTTRVRLDYQSVCILELQGLEYPPDGIFTEAELQPAVQLFITRAQRAQPAFEMNARTLPEIVRICQLVEGHPLALELAASGLRSRTCGQIAREIQTNLDSLQTVQQDLPARHRSIRAALDHIWLGLTDTEQQALTRLCIFTARFGLAAAQTIADCDIQMLSGLVGKSLLLQDALNQFWLQPLVRTYLLEILQADQELEQNLYARLSRYYLNFVNQRAEELLKGHHLCQLLEELERSIDSIRQAWEYALEQQAWEELLLGVEGIKHYFDVSGNLPEGRRWFSKLVAELMIPLLDEQQEETFLMLAGEAYQTLGWFDFRMGRLAAAFENLLESRQLFERLVPVQFPDLYIRGRSDTLNQLGFAAAALGDHERAREFFQQSLDFAQEVQDARAEAYAFLYLAEHAGESTAVGECERIYGDSLQVFKRDKDFRGAVRALIDLGDSAFQQNKNEKALRFYRAAHEQVGVLDSGWASAALFLKQAAVVRAQGDLEQAINFTEKSLEIYQEVGDLRRISAALNLLGGMHLSQREFQQAAIFHEEALDLALEVGSTPLVLACLVEIGFGYNLSGEAERARQIFQQVLLHPAATYRERLTAAHRMGEAHCDDEVQPVQQFTDRAYLSSVKLEKAVAWLLDGEALVPTGEAEVILYSAEGS